ncbi:MAG: hypothetical protein ACLFQA_05745 [Bacteroidales bacterium]
MKKILAFTVFTLLFVLVANSNEASAQRKYVDHSTVDGVDIQYRWAHSKWFDKSSPLELRLKIKNNNDYPVEVSYEIEFYMGPVMEETSDMTKICINPKLAKTGRINGMYYQSSKLSNKELESEEFTWEITNLEIERVESCR